MTTISACLIIRDEGQHLDACLEALQPFVDEICVLDTGSTDDSLAIAKRFEARIGHFEWCADFSAARNACIELATCEWVLMVDADELLDPESAPGLRAQLEDLTTQAYLVWIDNLDGGRDAQGRPTFHTIGIARLFRNRPEIRYARPVHESITDSLQALQTDANAHSGLRLVHHGYLPEAIERGGKHDRNLSILERHLVEQPDDVYGAYKLALTLLALGQHERARKVLAQAWQQAARLADGPRLALPFLPLLAAALVRELRRAGDLSGAHEVAALALEDHSRVSEVLFESAEVERACGRLEDAGEGYVAARSCEAWTDLYTGQPATRGTLPLCGLSRVAALAGDLELAGTCLAQALELDPQHIEARTIRARLDTLCGQEERAWSELSRLLNEAPADPHVLLFAAEMAWSRQEPETARGFWQGALAHDVSSSSARAWMVILELVFGDFEEARMQAQELWAADLPEAGALCILGGVLGEAPVLDPRFERAALRGELCAWLTELSRDPEKRALKAFERGAAVLEPLLGDLEGILAAPPA